MQLRFLHSGSLSKRCSAIPFCKRIIRVPDCTGPPAEETELIWQAEEGPKNPYRLETGVF